MKKRLLIICFIVFSALNVVFAQDGATRSQSVVTILGESFYVHTVQPQETIYGLSKLYNVEEEEIRKNNPQVAEGLRADQVLKIPVKGEVNSRGVEKELTPRQMRRTFTTHTVNKGETGYSISKRYGVSINTMIEDNKGFDPAHISIGQEINIRKESLGKTTSEEIDQQMNTYTEALNSLSDNFEHHLVLPQETIYSLSKRYGLPEETIRQYNSNELKDGLKAGSIIRIPAQKQPEEPPFVPFADRLRSNERPQRDDRFQIDNNIRVKNIDIQAPIKIAVMLPLRVNGVNNKQFLEFYQGILMGLDELKPMGISAKVDLFNTAKSESVVESLLNSREIMDADLIIGPVYDETFTPVADFARERGIPVVSPLASIERADNSLLYQVTPPESTKNDKLRVVLSGDKNIIVVSGPVNDQSLSTEMESLVPEPSHRINYNKDRFASEAERALSKDKENIFIILASSENIVEAIMARISSVQNNIVARSAGNPSIKVVGSSKWSRFGNMEKNLFYKLNAMYVASYYADRSDARVALFDKKYISSFSSVPTLYSYRGYDIAKLFVCNIKLHGNQFASYLNDGSVLLLQSPYRFEQTRSGSKYVNQEWSLVCYKDDYTVEVK